MLEQLGLDPTRATDSSEEALSAAVLALVEIPAQGNSLEPDQKARASAIAELATQEVIRHVVRVVQDSGLPPANLKFIHIAAPGPVDPAGAVVGYGIPAANVPGYDRYPLSGKVAQGVRDQLGVEVATRVENDARSRRLGERVAGAGKDFQRVAIFIWGTGMNGDDFAGRWFEPGHGLVGKRGSDDKWHYTLYDVRQGRPALASGQLELEQRLGGGAGLPEHWLKPAGFSSPPEVTSRARQGDEKAIRIIREAGEEFGRAIAVLFAKDYGGQGILLEKFILVSGIGENFGKGVQDGKGRDLLIVAIQDGAHEELVALGIRPEVAERMAAAIARSTGDSKLEMAAAAGGLRRMSSADDLKKLQAPAALLIPGRQVESTALRKARNALRQHFLRSSPQGRLFILEAMLAEIAWRQERLARRGSGRSRISRDESMRDFISWLVQNDRAFQAVRGTLVSLGDREPDRALAIEAPLRQLAALFTLPTWRDTPAARSVQVLLDALWQPPQQAGLEGEERRGAIAGIAQGSRLKDEGNFPLEPRALSLERDLLSPSEVQTSLREALGPGFTPSRVSNRLLLIFDPGMADLGRLAAELQREPVVIIAADRRQHDRLIQSGFGGEGQHILHLEFFDGNIEEARRAAAELYADWAGYTPRYYKDEDRVRLPLWLSDLLIRYDIPGGVLSLRQAEKILKALEALRAA